MYKMWNRSERDLRTTKYVLCTTPQYTLKQVRNRAGQKQIRNMSVRHETSSTVPKQPLRCKNNWTTTFMFDPCHSWNVQCSARSNLRDAERNVGTPFMFHRGKGWNVMKRPVPCTVLLPASKICVLPRPVQCAVGWAWGWARWALGLAELGVGRAGLGWAWDLAVLGGWVGCGFGCLCMVYIVHVFFMMSLCLSSCVSQMCIMGLEQNKAWHWWMTRGFEQSVFEKCDGKQTKWKQKERNGNSGNQHSLKRTAWTTVQFSNYYFTLSTQQYELENALRVFQNAFRALFIDWASQKRTKKHGCCECYLI